MDNIFGTQWRTWLLNNGFGQFFPKQTEKGQISRELIPTSKLNHIQFKWKSDLKTLNPVKSYQRYLRMQMFLEHQ